MNRESCEEYTGEKKRRVVKYAEKRCRGIFNGDIIDIERPSSTKKLRHAADGNHLGLNDYKVQMHVYRAGMRYKYQWKHDADNAIYSSANERERGRGIYRAVNNFLGVVARERMEREVMKMDIDVYTPKKFCPTPSTYGYDVEPQDVLFEDVPVEKEDSEFVVFWGGC